MQAITQNRYGSPAVLQVREVAVPVVDDDGVLVRVRAASVNPFDWHFMRGQPYFVRLLVGLRSPAMRIRGQDVAGTVEAVGGNVTQLHPGDEVFGACDGAFAEYVCGDERDFAPKPTSLTFEQAAAVPMAAVTALQALRDTGQLRPGQQVLINGASGGVGTFAVQIAKASDAEVTGVCSTRNLDLVRSLGADQVIDYTRADFSRAEQRFDLILDIVGRRPFRDFLRILRPTGTFVLVSGGRGRWIGPLVRVFKARVVSRFVRQRLVKSTTHIRREDLLALKDLMDAGKVVPVIDRTYPLSEVPEAIRYLEAGHARGKVVITGQRPETVPHIRADLLGGPGGPGNAKRTLGDAG
jgi:NADPH:quinone reductase-like Zn-dependent oxidoreductase